MAILSKQGTVRSLRVMPRGEQYGGANDHIMAEVGVELTDDRGAYGFHLLDDADLPVRQGYLDLLRDALAYGHQVELNVDVKQGKRFGRIVRVIVRPQPDQQGPISPWWSKVVTKGQH